MKLILAILNRILDGSALENRTGSARLGSNDLGYKLRKLMLPGLKRWIAIQFLCIAIIILGVFLLLGYHPITVTGNFIREMMEHAVELLPSRISGVIIITCGALFLFFAIARMTISVLGAYLPTDRESIPDVLYRRRHLDRGPKVVVIGGGTGLSNLLRGLKNYTSNITAIVTVGDDGGSSGRLREELGVLPPGDIRNCITALADEEALVTELFRYRFEAGQGLEGHSFGNLFLTALCSITKGDMLEAVRVASRVLNSCGQVLPSTLNSISLVAEMADGRTVRGESQISAAKGKITRLSCEPANPVATPEALAAIATADLIVLGPGSLYTSICPNLLINGIPEALRQARARKIYICNVMTQEGETTGYSVADHVQALLVHTGVIPGVTSSLGGRLIHAVLVNADTPSSGNGSYGAATPVRYDPERLKELKVGPVRRSVLSSSLYLHHDPDKLAKEIMEWFVRQKKRKPQARPPASRADGPTDKADKASKTLAPNTVNEKTARNEKSGNAKEVISAPAPDSTPASEQIVAVKSSAGNEVGTPPGQ